MLRSPTSSALVVELRRRAWWCVRPGAVGAAGGGSGVVGGDGRFRAVRGDRAGRAPPAVRAVAKPPTTISQTPSIKPTVVTILLV